MFNSEIELSSEIQNQKNAVFIKSILRQGFAAVFLEMK
jgi:hypothetical protein